MEVWIIGVVTVIVCASQNRKHLVKLKNTAKCRQQLPCFLCLNGPGFCQSNQTGHISVQYMVIISNTDTWLLLWRPMCSLKWWRGEFLIFYQILSCPLALFSVVLWEHGLRMESREQNSERLWEHSRKTRQEFRDLSFFKMNCFWNVFCAPLRSSR